MEQTERVLSTEAAVEESHLQPYVGPRTFRAEEHAKFFGRDREARELVSRIISRRVVLFRAPSGAGKSSLLNTCILTGLQEKGFAVLPTGRVGGHPGNMVDAENIFVYNLLNCLLGEGVPRTPDLNKMTLAHFLNHLVRENGTYYFDPDRLVESRTREPRVLVIDQFEEILTTNEAQWQQRAPFFTQLSEALEKDEQLWLLLAMRQDFVDAVTRYLRVLPGGEPIPYAMERLDYAAALDAIKNPVEKMRKFESDAAERLAEKLRVKKYSDLEFETEFIEPLQLQVVCSEMWKQLERHPGDSITVQDVENYADVEEALGNLYESTIEQTVKSAGVSEGDLRRWFGEKLITKERHRNLVWRGETSSGDLPTSVTDAVSKHPIVHRVQRSNADWYELVHDRFVEPILASNEAWSLQRNRSSARSVIAFAIMVVAFVVIFFFIFRSNVVSSAEATVTNVAATAENAKSEALEAAVTAESAEVAAAAAEADASAAIAEKATANAIPEIAVNLVKKARNSEKYLEKLQYALDAVNVTYTFNKTYFNDAVFELYSAVSAFPVPENKIEWLDKHENQVVWVDYSPDGEHILTTSSVGTEGVVYLWEEPNRRSNISSPQLVEPVEPVEILRYKDSIRSAVFSPNGSRILTTGNDNTPRLWNRDGELLAELKGHIESVNMAAFSPDGRMIATASDDTTVRLWNSEGQLIRILFDHEGPVRSALFSPDGEHILTASDDGTVRLWESKTDRVLIKDQALLTSARFSPDGRHFVTTSLMDNSVQLWDSEGQRLAVLEGHTAPVNMALFSPGGKSIITASEDGKVRLWDLNGQAIATVIDHSEPVNAIAFSPDGKHIATASNDRSSALVPVYPDIEVLLNEAERLLLQETE